MIFWICLLVQLVALAVGYDSRYLKHGDRNHELYGATCREFLNLNNMDTCCLKRDDDCFMIHFDTRCYCDVFCERPDSSDCCPDARGVCRVQPPTFAPFLPLTTKTQTASLFCFHSGKWYTNGQRFQDNCNECFCTNGNVKCSNNRCLINTDLLHRINSDPYLGWRADNYSNFWSKNLEYGYKHKLGTKIPIRIQRGIRNDPTPIKPSYDFRSEPFMVNNIRPVRDQGECGASWAFSALEAATDRAAKVYEGKRGNESMSVQMLLSCTILPGNVNGCSATTMDIGWKFIESTSADQDGKILGGIVNEACYPLESDSTGSASSCKVNSNLNRVYCPSDGRLYTKPLMNSGPGYPIRAISSNDLMEEIIENGPIQIAFKVFEDFFMYKGGIYSKHPNARIMDVENPYHSVKVIGWGSENDIDYWIAANSWGPDWGENGYFRIKREDGETEFGRYGYAAWGSRSINTKNKNNFGKNKFRYFNIHRRE